MNEHQKLLNIFHKTTHQKLLNADRVLDITKTTAFYFRLEKCLMSSEYYNHSQMGPLLLVLDTSSVGIGIDLLSPKNMEAFLKTGASRKCNTIFLDYDGKEIGNHLDNLLIENPAEACDFSSRTQMNIFFIHKNELNIFSHGKYIDCIPNLHLQNKVKKFSDASLPASEYKQLINTHYRERVRKDNILNFWQNKKDRLLVAAPERIFGNDLACYLDQNIADGHVDIECYNAWSNNRTDIRILKYEDQKIYIIEVKWLGKSKSYAGKITEYKDDRANSGIVQLNDYLQAETAAICGVLVIYDARKNDEDVKWDTRITRDARIETPVRFYLISESASDKAKRVIKELKRK